MPKSNKWHHRSYIKLLARDKMFINNMTLIEFNWHDEEFVNDTNDIKCAIIKYTE